MTTDLPHTTRLNRALTFANTIAGQHGHDEVGVETLIVALVRNNDGTAEEIAAITKWAQDAEKSFEGGWRPDPTTA